MNTVKLPNGTTLEVGERFRSQQGHELRIAEITRTGINLEYPKHRHPGVLFTPAQLQGSLDQGHLTRIVTVIKLNDTDQPEPWGTW